MRRAPLAAVALAPLIAAAAVAAETAAPAPAAAGGVDAAATVTLTPARAHLVLGKDAETTITVEVEGPEAARYLPVRALATVGVIELPRPSGLPGQFVARYAPPLERFPQVALIVVELAAGARRAHAATRILLDGSTIVPFHTSPGATVTMRVSERAFGPATADAKGHVEIAIEVPPGVRTGSARAVDHNGAVRETDVDLQLPPFPRLLVLTQADAIEVGSFAEIDVFALAADGGPAFPGQVALTASAGLVRPLAARTAGELRYLYEAPRQLGSGAVALSATAAGAPTARSDVALGLRAGPPATLAFTSSAHRLVVGEHQAAQITMFARDMFGNPAPAIGFEASVDGAPAPVEPAPNGTATLAVAPPARFSGRDHVTIDARLGALRARDVIHVTGGAPTLLKIDVRDRRVVADGKTGTEVRVRAVDRNGTPTLVPGLSWQTPGGRVRNVRVPHDGEYVAEFVPDRARDPHRELVAVMASPTLRAQASVDVAPAPVRVLLGARAGLFTNFGRTLGPSVFVEALRPLRVPRVRMFAGLAAGYLRGDVSGRNVATGGTARLETNQIPLLAVARAWLPTHARLELAAELAAGVSWASTRVTVGNPAVVGTATALAAGGGAELGLPLRPGRLTVGLRYLWASLGRDSQGDRIDGNSAGLIADLGYKMTF